MIFPLVMYRCENWSIKKAEGQRIDAFKFMPVNLKEIKPEYSLEGLILKLKLQYFDYLMGRANSLEMSWKGRKRRGQQRMRYLKASMKH